MGVPRNAVMLATGLAALSAGCGPRLPEGRVVAVSIPAPSLAGSVVPNTPGQPAMVWLPPSYDGERRFPVIYYLPGFTTDVTDYFDGTFRGWRLDRALDRGVAAGAVIEAIVVVVNGRNALGGSFYVDSPTTGRWEGFIVDDVVAYLDATFATIPTRNGRGLAGDSMGGFGAVNLAMRHPRVYRAAYALSPCLFAPTGLDESDLLNRHRAAALGLLERTLAEMPETARRRSLFELVGSLQRSGSRFNYDNGFLIAYAAAFAPERAGSSWMAGFSVVDHGTAEPGFDVTSRAWLASGFGGWEEKVRVYRNELLALDGLVLDCGRNDRLSWIPEGCGFLSGVLQEAGITHELRFHDGGHVDRLGERLETGALPYLSRMLHKAAGDHGRRGGPSWGVSSNTGLGGGPPGRDGRSR